MAEAVITKIAKIKMLKARAGDKPLAKIVGMAFGSGGVGSGGEIIKPKSEQNALNNELLRKEIRNHAYIGDTACRYTCVLEANELAGKNISEIALYDSDGDIVAIKNFATKGKDADIEMTFNIDDVFE